MCVECRLFLRAFEDRGIGLQTMRRGRGCNAGKINRNAPWLETQACVSRARLIFHRENESIGSNNKVKHLFDDPRYTLARSKTVMPSGGRMIHLVRTNENNEMNFPGCRTAS